MPDSPHAARRGLLARIDPMIVSVNAVGLSLLTSWGASYYFLGILAKPIAASLGASLSTIYLGFTLALLLMSLISTSVGRLIDRHGARAIMSAGAVIVSAGLLIVSQAYDLFTYFAGWAVLGVGMRCTLYDSAFPAIVQVVPTRGRRAISYLTLYGAYASTVFWVLGHYINEAYGWRGTLIAFALIHLVVCLPLTYIGLGRREERSAAEVAAAAAASPDGPVLEGRQRSIALALLALIISLNAFVFAVISLQMVTLIEAAGLAGATAVWVASLKGHGQFLGRLIEIVFGQRLKALTVARISVAALPAALILLMVGHGSFAWLVAFSLVIGAAQGVFTIVRGALPLALFGANGYGTLIGLIATPNLVVGATAPAIFALMLDHLGWNAALAIIMACAAIACIAMEIMGVWYRRAEAGSARHPAG